MKSFSALLVFLQLALTSISRVSASPIGSLESRADIAFVWNNGHEAQEERRSSNELRDNIAFTWKNEPNGRSSNVIPFGPWKDEAPDRRSSNKLRHDIGEDHKDHRSSNEIRFSNVPFDWRRSNELRTSANVAVGNQHQSRSSNELRDDVPFEWQNEPNRRSSNELRNDIAFVWNNAHEDHDGLSSNEMHSRIGWGPWKNPPTSNEIGDVSGPGFAGTPDEGQDTSGKRDFVPFVSGIDGPEEDSIAAANELRRDTRDESGKGYIG